MRQIRHFGTWTVTKLVESNSRAILEGLICNGTQVIGWHTNEVSRRFWRFHAEMSGFAFNSTILWDPKRWHRPTLEPIRQLDTVNEGIQVSTFMEQVVEDESQMECLPQNCSRIMIRHLHVESSFSYPPEWFLKYNNKISLLHLLESFDVTRIPAGMMMMMLLEKWGCFMCVGPTQPSLKGVCLGVHVIIRSVEDHDTHY